MNKRTEITILQSLENNTYFNDFFGNSGVNKMIQNIKNDHPIELDVCIKINDHYIITSSYKKEISELIGKIETIEKTNTTKRNKMLETLLCRNNSECEDIVKLFYTPNEVVIAKLSIGLSLTNIEINMIKKRLNGDT